MSRDIVDKCLAPFQLKVSVLTLTFALVCSYGIASELEPGDIAFTSFNADGNKRFSFVLLTEITDSTAIYFTDNGWNASTDVWHNTTEGTMLWYYNGTLSCGTEITIDPTQDTTNIGTVSEPDGGFNISAAGDAILAYVGDTINDPTTFIAAINQDAGEWNGPLFNTTDTDLPDELSPGINAVAFPTHADNWQYDCGITGAFPRKLAIELNKTSNWISNDDIEYLAPGCISGCEGLNGYASRSGSGYALDFDGVDDHFIIGDVDALSFGDGASDNPFTISAWINLTSTPAGTEFIFSKKTAVAWEYQLTINSSGSIIGAIRDASEPASLFVGSTKTLEEGEWTHVAMTYDGSGLAAGLSLYINGIDQTGTPSTIGAYTAMENTVGNFNVGSQNGTGQFVDMKVDELRVWSDTLNLTTIRDWMTKKINSNHPNVSDLLFYFRFDDADGVDPIDLAGGVPGAMNNMDAADWVRSGAPLGDDNIYTYGGTAVNTVLGNGNAISVDGFTGSPSGVHLYHVTDTATGSSFPGDFQDVDSLEYFGVFMIGGASYDVTIDYTSNASINGSPIETNVRGLKRSNGEDTSWEISSGFFDTDTSSKTITIADQTGTEYVTGFANTAYLQRVGAGYALDFDGSNDMVDASANAWFPDDQVDDYTYEAWINSNDVSGVQGIIDYSYDNNNNEPHSLILLVNGAIRARLRADNETTYYADLTGGVVVQDKWYHVALTKNGNVFRLYLDGVLIDSVTATINGVWTFNRNKLILGANWNLGTSYADEFKGKIDEVRIWKTALSQDLLRTWMSKKLTNSHDSIVQLAHYYRFDEAAGSTLNDLTGTSDGVLTAMDTVNAWVRSGAALGDESYYTYIASSLTSNLSNGNQITLDGYAGAEGIHLYIVNDTATGSNYPNDIVNADSNQYFGVHLADGASYDVTIDYSGNNAINGQPNEPQARGLKRSGGDDATWQTTSGFFNTNTDNNTISILNQTGTEYVTGFTNAAYPERAGSGFALDFDGTNDYVAIPDDASLDFTDTLSITMWVKPASVQGLNAQLLNKQPFGNSGYVIEQDGTNTNQYKFLWSNGGGFASHPSNFTLVADEWQHLAIVKTGTLVKVYINGEIATSGSGAYAAIANSPSDLNLGNFPTLSFVWGGELDEVSLWNIELDTADVRDWMCKKINGGNPNIGGLVSYYRFDDEPGGTLEDLTGTNNGTLTNMNNLTDWVPSGAALGDQSVYTYGGTSISDSLDNGNAITLDNFSGVDGIHLYTVMDTATGSSYPGGVNNVDSTEYFGAFMLGGTSYDVTIDYTSNTALAGSGAEKSIRAIKRDAGDDPMWKLATGRLRVDAAANTISIPNQNGTEYLTGFSATSYPDRAGSGYALTLDGVNQHVQSFNSGFSGISTADSLTVEAWVKTTDASAFPYIFCAEESNSASLRILYSSGRPRISIREHPDSGGISIRTDSTYNDGQWHHIAFTYDGSLGPGGMNIYVDGIDVPTSTSANNPTAAANYADSSYIGIYRQLNNALNGSIDELRLWNSVIDQTTIRDWMCRKLNSNHGEVNDLLSYYRFDEASGDTLFDIAGGATGALANAPSWTLSGAALGDESFYTYGGNSLSDTLSNGNVITLNDFNSADGMHLYFVNDTATGSSYPGTINDIDSSEYFGVFKIGGTSYDVTIDYSSNAAINGQANEALVRGIKRSGGDDATWQAASGELRTNTAANTISIINQTGTEYVTGFANASYPVRPGSGYALDFDGIDDQVLVANSGMSAFSTTDSLTFEFWVKTTDSTAGTPNFLSVNGDSGSQRMVIYLNGGQPRFGINDQSGLVISMRSNKTVNDGKWHHIAFVYDGSESPNGMSIYVDGFDYGKTNLQNQAISTYSFNDSLRIATNINASGNFIDATLDEIRVWNSALDSNQIREWMTKKVNASHDNIANLLAYYRLDENAGTTVSDLASGATGSLTNGPVWVVSGAALGDESSYAYDGSVVSLVHTSGDSITLGDYAGSMDGIHLYYVDTASNSNKFSGAEFTESGYYFGVHKVGADTASYSVTYSYANSSLLTGATNENRVALAKRANNADSTWESTRYFGITDTSANSVFLPNQTGTEYAGIISANNALDFDGVNDGVSIPHSEDFNFDIDDDFTVALWMRIPATQTNSTAFRNTIITKNEAGEDRPFAIFVNNQTSSSPGRIYAQRRISGVVSTINSQATVNDNNWHHVAFVKNGSELNIYVDGLYENITPGADSSIVSISDTGNLYLGNNPNNRYLDGSLDELRIWSRALCESEIQAQMSCEFDSIFSDSLVLYMSFNQGVADSNNAGSDSLIDLSGNNHHGTLSNFALSGTTSNWTMGAPVGGGCSPYAPAQISILGNGVVIADGDSTISFADSTYIGLLASATPKSVHYSVVNAGQDTLRIDSVFFTGTDSADFSVTYTATVAPDDTGLIVMTVNSTAAGDIFATINIENSVCGTSPYTFEVSANVLFDYPERVGAGYALNFDGVDDYINLNDVDAVEGISQLTIEAWVKPESLSDYRGIVSKFASASDAIDLTAGGTGVGTSQDIYFRIGNGANSYVHTTSQPLQVNEWVHIAAVFDGQEVANNDRMRLYVNGVPESLTYSGTYPTTTSNSNTDLEIGRYQALYEWGGDIDEVRIWNAALDSNQIRTWMTRKVTASHDSIASLVSYYRFDENSDTNLYDKVGGNNGQLMNMDSTSDWVYSGAALGDTSVYTYSASALSTTMNNGNGLTLFDYDGANGIHLYVVNDTAVGSSFPVTLDSAQSEQYFGVFMVGGTYYDLAIGYSGNASLSAASNESQLRGVKRDGGDDNTWSLASGLMRTNTTTNVISILNQTGTEYVTGFTNVTYPDRAGSGYALDFDGQNGHIDLPLSLNPSTSEYTIECWLRVDSIPTTFGYGIVRQNGPGGRAHITVDPDGKIGNFLAGVSLKSANAIQPDKWYHVAVSYDGTVRKIYVNGSLEASSTVVAQSADSSWAIGSPQSAFVPSGQIDEVRFWNTELDSNLLRQWMCKKLNASHDSLSTLLAYYRFDDIGDTTLVDLAGGNDGTLFSMDASTDWVYSGAAVGDESVYTYGGTTLSDSLGNGNAITVNDFAGADGIHLYTVSDTATGSTLPNLTGNNVDSSEYFGVFMVGGSSYDVTINYSSNSAINGVANEGRVRGVKRSGGDDAAWSMASGEFRTNTDSNTISILNQTGTEYVTGFANATYPSRAGSGYALDFDGSTNYGQITNSGMAGLNTLDSFSIEFWFNSTDTSQFPHLASIKSPTTAARIATLLNYGQVRFTVRSAPSTAFAINTIDTFNDGQWHHVAYTYDGSEDASGMNIYVDGLDVATTVSSNNSITTFNFNDSVNIGASFIGGQRLDGRIDEIRFWNGILDSTLIRQWMCQKIPGTHPEINDLIAYYRLDEGTDTTFSDLVGGGSGALFNSTAWVLSGAALGDTSAYDYTGIPVVLGSAAGDSIVSSNFSGGATGLHVYRVDQAPNDTLVPIGANFMDTTHYYGVFMAGGTNPLLNIAMSYDNNAGYVATNNGDDLVFLGRDGNDDSSWSTKASALLTNNTTADTVSVFAQPSGTEIIVGRGSYLTPPGSGFALEFDGTNDFIEIPDDNAFDMSAVTIETWVYWDGGAAIEFISGKATEELELHINGAGVGGDSAIRFIPTTAVYLDAPAQSFLPNRWNHVAAVYDPSNTYGEVYINGVAQNAVNTGANPLTTPITTSASNYYLGIRSNGTLPLNGQLDEFRMWNAALDSTVIRKWMSRKMDITHDSIANLVSYYRFDQQGDTNLIDLIGSNHGALTNMDETADWVTSGAAIGDMSVFTYDSTALGIELPNNDSVFLTNFDAGVQGVQLYYVGERSNFTDFYGAQSVDTTFYFGVHKAGDDTATYDVTLRYGNSSHLTGSSNQYRIGLAKRDNNADSSWEADWFNGTTNTGTETIFLPNQTGTEYAGIVSANNALNFDGVNDNVSFPGYTVPGEFTIEAWININAASSSFTTIIEFGNDAPYIGLDIGRPVFYQSVLSTDTIAYNEWHHLAVTYDSNTYEGKMYVDGTLIGTGNTQLDISGIGMGIGHNTGDDYFNGAIDEVRIWNRVLCEDEIAASMNCQFDSNNLDSLVAYYSFNQGVADSTNTGLDSLIDLSGNGNNGTLTNMALAGASSNWTDGATGITGACTPYLAPAIYVISEGDTIVNYDSIASVLDSTGFGEVVLFETYTVNYGIYNGGGDTLDIDSIFFTGTDSSMFVALHSNNIAPNDTGFITMQVTPTVSDSIEAYLNITSNECGNSPYRFAVSGFVLGYAGALNFDGVDDYVNIPDTVGYQGMSELTVEAYIRINDTNALNEIQAIVSTTGGNLVHLQASDNVGNNVAVYTNNGTLLLDAVPETPFDVWKHVALTVKSGETRLFVDGTQLGATNTTLFDSINIDNTVRIGSGNAGVRFFNGDIDEVRIWDRALDSTEIQANMMCELEGTECGLLAYYNFNSDTAIIQANNTGITTLTDSSGNGIDGTLTNFTLNGSSSNWSAQSDSILNNCSSNPDVVGPVVIPRDTVIVYIDAAGVATIDPLAADSASCDYGSGIDSLWTNPVSVTCANNFDSIYLFAQDSVGLLDSAAFVVMVLDTQPPFFVTQSARAYVDASGSVTIATDTLIDSLSDQCYGAIVTPDSVTFGCGNITILGVAAADAQNFSLNATADGPVGQTFVATATGLLTNITLQLRNLGIASTETLEFYRGDPNSGVLLATETFNLPVSATVSFNSINLTNPPLVVAGDTYSFKIPTLSTVPLQGYGYVTANTYPQGQIYTGAGIMTPNPGQDIYFLTSVQPTSNLQSVALTATDSAGNQSVDTAFVVVLDTTPPVAIAQNVSVSLNNAGFALLNAAMFDNSSTDNCGVDSIAIDVDTVFCADTVGINVTLTVFDTSGNFSTAVGVAIVTDDSAPTVLVQTDTIYLNSSGIAFTNPAASDGGSFDNCAIDSIWLTDTAFFCGDTGIQASQLIVRDSAGNADTANVSIYVRDTILPTVIAQNITVQLDSGGQVSIDTGDINNGSFDNCSIDSLWLSDTLFTCADTIGDTVWLVARDINNNIDSAFAIITIEDTLPPVALSQQRTIYLDSTGVAVIQPDTLNNGSSDNCAIDSLWLSQSTFACIDTNGILDTLFIRDVSGNLSFSTDTVFIRDTLPPIITAQNLTVYLNANGADTIDTADINLVTTDNCSLDTMWLSRYTFDCSDTGANQVTLSARDVSGNMDSLVVTVTVLDTVLPTVLTQNITVQLDASGQVSIDTGDINNGSFDNCSIDSLWLSDTLFTCSDTLGDTVWLIARDINNNIDSAFAIITTEDTLPPVALSQQRTIYLDSSGVAVIQPDTLNNGSSDNCAIDSLWLSQSTFACIDTNGILDTLFVQDVSGNVSFSTDTVFIRDTLAPIISVTNDTIYLNAVGVATLDTGMVNNGTTDNCAIDSLWLSDTLFDCADTVAANPVTFFARDISGNTSSYGIVVVVVDTVRPQIVTMNDTVYLDTSGLVSIDTSTISLSVTDNCLLDTVWLSAYNFTCADTLDTVITLFAQDFSGNRDSATATVTILDTVRPILHVQNIEVYLDSNGMAVISPDTVDSASTDNCGILNRWISKDTFLCADTLFPDTIQFAAGDVSNNWDTTTVVVTVLDTQPPVVIPRNLTVYLDTNGGVSFTPDTIDSASIDNCLIDSIWLSTDTFSCIDSNANNVTLFVRDISGNIDSAITTVTVLDTVAPTVITRNQVVYLDSFGALTIAPDTLDSASFDNCNIDSTWLSANTFTCADTNDTVLTLFVRDVSGNIDSSTATLTIRDTLIPIIVTNDITVYLDTGGMVTITADTVDSNTTDNCDLASIAISDSTFTCADTGAPQVITFYATDISGNMDSTIVNVTVRDTSPPNILANGLTLYLDSFGLAIVANDSADAGTDDNCLLDSVWLEQTVFTCSDSGVFNIEFYAVDFSNNIDTVVISVSVEDTIAPQVYAQDFTAALDSFGSFTLTPMDVDSGSWDSCGIASYSIDTSNFICASVGDTFDVVLTVTDISGNTSSDTSVVNVIDNIAPQVITQNIVLSLDSFGGVSFTTALIDNGSWDSCGIASLALNIDTFDCSDVGVNVVTLTATDVNGNVNSATANVTVNDLQIPEAVAYTDTIIIFLDTLGQAFIAADTVDSSSFDNCSFTKAIDVASFTCVDVGFTLPVVLTITDASGNIDMDTAYVYIDDTIPPIPTTMDSITVFLDSFGMVSIDTSDVLIAISDTCAIANIQIVPNSFSCANTGQTVTVTTTITDTVGNVGSDTTIVTIIDNIRPIPIARDTTVYLGSNGLAVIDSNGLDSASNDACGIQSIVNERDTFNCSDVGAAIPIWMIVTDSNGNQDSIQANVTVEDTIHPVLVLHTDTLLHLAVNGLVTVTDSIVDSNSLSFDNCAITSRSNAPSVMNCSDVGDTVYSVVTMTDASGNSTIDSVAIYTADTVRPNVITQNFVAQLDSFGNDTISWMDIDNGSSDACGIVQYRLSDSIWSCADTGDTVIYLIATDTNGNIDSASAVVTIQDNIAPLLTAQDDTIFLDANGDAFTFVDSVRLTQFDGCQIETISLSDSVFDCSDLGSNSVNLTAIDYSGNSTTVTVNVEVVDTTPPVVSVVDTVIYLDVLGSATLDTSYVNDGTTDNCNITSFTLSTTNFDCDDAGDTVTVIVTVTDQSSNQSIDSVQVRILDTVRPNVVTQNIIVQLDSFGNDTIDWTDIDFGSSDACDITQYRLSDSIWTCADTGDVTVYLIATDSNGNIDSASAVVTIQDNIAPLLTAQDDTIFLDANGDAFTFVDSVRLTQFDGCQIETISLSDSVFDCSDLGSNSIDLTAIDYSGNSTTVTVNVEVVDSTPPVVSVVDTVIYLDVLGSATLDTSYVNDGTTDNCNITSFTLSTTNFDCDDAGDTVTVIVTVTDQSSNQSIDSVQVRILDTVRPNVVTQNITVQLDSFGNDTIDWTDIDFGSTDACDITQYRLSDSIWSCLDIGPNDIYLIATDSNGNVDSALATVTVEDNVAPSAFAFDSLIVFLDSSGNWTIDTGDIDSATTDNCAIDTMYLSQYDFDCADIGGPIFVTLTVEDLSGNVSTDQTVVTVFDTVAPHIVMVNDTVYLDPSGLATVDSSNFDAGTWDSCGVATLSIDTANLSCDHTVDSFKVILTATDVNGNVSVDSSYLFVLDTILPTIACRADTTLSNDSGQCGAVFVFDTASAFDNCSIDTIIQTDNSGLVSGDEFPVGVTIIEFTAFDVYGNSDSCSFSITVIDTQAPEIVCPADTVICDTVYSFALPVTLDNCPNDSIEQIAGIESGGNYPVGITVNTFVVTDASGLTDTCSFTVTRDDFPSEAIAITDTALCDTVQFNLSSVAPTVGIGAWGTLGAASVTDTTSTTSQVSGLIVGANEFVWRVSNGVCPVEVDTASIMISEEPTRALLPSDQSLCDQDETQIIANTPLVGEGVWSTSASISINDTASDTITVSGIPLGSHALTWSIANGVCDISSDSIVIHNNVIPTVDAGINVSRFAGKSVTLAPIVIDGASYLWTPQDVFDDPTVMEATASVIRTTTLVLTVTSDSGCVMSDSLLYSVNDLDSIPTGITPNGDDINDVWNIPGLSAYPEAEVYIYDQGGREIFYSKGYDTPWDGQFNGQVMPRASYFWIIDLKDDVNEPLKGIISIIR